MASQDDSNSALGPVFAVLGIIAAIASGCEQDMGGGEILVFALFMAAIGYFIGRVVEWILLRILFTIIVIILILRNVMIGQFIRELLSAIF